MEPNQYGMGSVNRTALAQAREVAAILQRYGIKTTDHHYHVGENGTRCEFCRKPVWAKVHDPLRLGRGEE